ncbi:MAG TPA: toll/interleukin-1 receptor domain-containing protein [Blastocatellia bacterium]|nr:toll/interleukin-1 receptor domain-containing protein [Blastocatellia bacterium]
MANEEHLNILKQGTRVWNQWRFETATVSPDLTGADLREADLSEADLSGVNLSATRVSGLNLTPLRSGPANLSQVIFSEADLRRTVFRRANLSEADLLGANLSHADLREADLSEVDFSQANLSGASLTGANLMGANLSHADLNGTDFSNATIGFTTFVDNDLSRVVGLDSVKHSAPSGIGIDTIYTSKGNIPEVFLRGAGVPDNFIAYMRSLAGSAFEYYSCFISYSSKNHDFAERLHADLQSRGVRCWFAPEDMKIGDRIRPRIDETIRLHDKLLLVLSRESIASEWVEAEVEAAIEKEKPGRTVLFPIRLDDAVMGINSGWPALVKRTRHIGDFTRWKEHDDYQKAFDRLLRDLKSDEAKT